MTNVAQWFDYAPYGSVIASTNTGQTGAARQYINRFADQSNLDYLNARYYNPAQGQFITQDPVFWGSKQNLANPQSLNSYSYSNDNPINKSDPDGLAAATLQGIFQQLVSILQTYISILTSLGGGSAGGRSNTNPSSNMPSGTVLRASVAQPAAPQVSNTYYNYTFAATQSQSGQVHTPYRLGSKGPDAVDCSGSISNGIRQSINPHFGNPTADELYNDYTLPGDSTGIGTVNFYTNPGSDIKAHVTTNIENGLITQPDEGKGYVENVSPNRVTPYFDTVQSRQLNWLTKLICEIQITNSENNYLNEKSCPFNFLIPLFALYRASINARVDVHDFKLVSTLRTKEGEFLGNVHAKYFNDAYFTVLYILGKNDELLYRIRMDSNGFVNTKGKDMPEIEPKGFYGYKITHVSNDLFEFNYFRNDGKVVSDPEKVEWNYEKKYSRFGKSRPNTLSI